MIRTERSCTRQLPFNCQWQELKDLMRGAGAVLRAGTSLLSAARVFINWLLVKTADIAAGPDGRSRGFGSVLFSTAHDADRAVQMFNGYAVGITFSFTIADTKSTSQGTTTMAVP